MTVKSSLQGINDYMKIGSNNEHLPQFRVGRIRLETTAKQ